MAWHGTESNGRPRSSRAWEFYGNTITCPASTECQEAIGARGGTGLTWGNTTIFGSSAGMHQLISLATYRTQGNPGNTSWQGACDGSSAYDSNDGTTYFSGTVSSWNSGTSVLTVSGSPGWTTNQWAGSNITNGTPYSLHDVTQSNGTEISANGSNTLTLVIGGGPGAFTTPSNGDSIQILRATKCIDQAGGLGAGILYSGSPASPASSANEVASPTYEWMDTFTGGTPSAIVYSDTARIIQNRDFFMETSNQSAQSSSSSPFNGTSGMGHGVLADRPTTCTQDVGYWATDQGDWNQSGSGGQGELFLCTATNTWTLSYTPYTYPHPLTVQERRRSLRLACRPLSTEAATAKSRMHIMNQCSHAASTTRLAGGSFVAGSPRRDPKAEDQTQDGNQIQGEAAPGKNDEMFCPKHQNNDHTEFH